MLSILIKQRNYVRMAMVVVTGFALLYSWQLPPAGVAQAQDAAAPAAADAAAMPAPLPAETTRTATPNKTILQVLMEAGIFWILLFFAISLVAVFFIVEHTITIRKEKLMPEQLLLDLEHLVEEGQIDEAIAHCSEPHNRCMTSDIVLAGLERFVGSEFGFAEYKTAMEEAGEDQTGHLYRKTEVLGVIGAVAPMLGLTGTVFGMISAFNTIASTEGAAEPSQVAGGISTALITTLLGLVVAIPCMIAYSFFRNRIDSIVAEAGKRIERLMMPLGRKRV